MYTKKNIETILHCLGLKQGIFNPCKVNDSYCHIYYFQTLTPKIILAEFISYLRLYLAKIQQRRICFLSTLENNEPYALFIECKYIDSVNLNALQNLLQKANKANKNDLTKSPDFLEALNKLYKNTTCIFLAYNQPQANWEQLVASVYNINLATIQPLSKTNNSIVFIEFIREFMLQGFFPSAVDVKKIYKLHFKACLNSLNARLQKFQIADVVRYISIETYLSILFKYTLLKDKRVQLPSLVSSLEQIEKIQAIDHFF